MQSVYLAGRLRDIDPVYLQACYLIDHVSRLGGPIGGIQIEASGELRVIWRSDGSLLVAINPGERGEDEAAVTGEIRWIESVGMVRDAARHDATEREALAAYQLATDFERSDACQAARRRMLVLPGWLRERGFRLSAA